MSAGSARDRGAAARRAAAGAGAHTRHQPARVRSTRDDQHRPDRVRAGRHRPHFCCAAPTKRCTPPRRAGATAWSRACRGAHRRRRGSARPDRRLQRARALRRRFDPVADVHDQLPFIRRPAATGSGRRVRPKRRLVSLPAAAAVSEAEVPETRPPPRPPVTIRTDGPAPRATPALRRDRPTGIWPLRCSRASSAITRANAVAVAPRAALPCACRAPAKWRPLRPARVHPAPAVPARPGATTSRRRASAGQRGISRCR